MSPSRPWLNFSVCTALLVFSPAVVFSDTPTTEEKSAHVLKGLLLTVERQSEENRAHVKGVEVKDLVVPGKVHELEKKLSELAIGKPINSELLAEIKQSIADYYTKHRHPLVVITIPEQDITDGVVEVLITEARLGKVTCKGHRWFNSKILESYLDINPGEIVSWDTLLNDVNWMNRNPFRRTDIVFTPGEEFGTTNIDLVTKDRFPVRVYAGGDNTGNKATGNKRWYAGFNWGNAFGCDHQLTYHFTTSSDFHEFQSHLLNYSAPLPWRHILLLLGGYSRVHPDLTVRDKQYGDYKSHGHSAQASFRYQIPFGLTQRLHEIAFGFDFKNTNNNLEFIGDENIPVITNTVNLGQFALGYNWGRETKHHRFSFVLETFGSPGRIFPNQSNADFSNLRPGAKNRYAYGKLTIGDVYRLPMNFSTSVLLRGQLSSQNLLPSEEFGIGGFNTVRGYEEREVNADNAFVANFEFRSFPFHLLKNNLDDLIFLGFVDYGIGRNHKKVPEEKTLDYLLGAGPGLRYTINPYLSLRVDWGFILNKTNFDDLHMSKVHFGLLISY